MNEEIEKLIKIQVVINKNKYHLCVSTNLEDKSDWRLYQVFADYDMYFSSDNTAILNSDVDTIDDLIKYLQNHKGITIK